MSSEDEESIMGCSKKGEIYGRDWELLQALRDGSRYSEPGW